MHVAVGVYSHVQGQMNLTCCGQWSPKLWHHRFLLISTILYILFLLQFSFNFVLYDEYLVTYIPVEVVTHN